MADGKAAKDMETEALAKLQSNKDTDEGEPMSKRARSDNPKVYLDINIGNQPAGRLVGHYHLRSMNYYLRIMDFRL